MKEGGEATFYIPAKLAYREVGAGDKIGPNATLVFDVKLVKVARLMLPHNNQYKLTYKKFNNPNQGLRP